MQVLRIPEFRKLWIGQATSQFGDALYHLCFLFVVQQLTHDPRKVGIVGALETLPFVLFGPYAGAIADRIDRRKIMLFADLASAVLLGFLALWVWRNPKPPIEVIYVIAFLLSSVNSFFAPAKTAAIPRLVSGERLLEANSLSSATQSMMPMLGIGLSGAVLGAIWMWNPSIFFLIAVLVNMLSFLVSASYIRSLPGLVPERKEVRASGWKEAMDGLKFVRRTNVLWVAFLTSLLMNLFIAPFMVVYMETNSRWFDGQYRTIAFLEFGFMVGMVISSLLVGRIKVRRPGISFTVGLALVGVLVAVLGISRSFWLYFTWNLIAGLVLPFATIPINTYIQMTVKDEMRGRVSSSLYMAQIGVQPIGMLLSGWMIDRVGLVGMYLVMGLGMGAAALIGAFDREFRATTMDSKRDDSPTLAV